MKAQVVSFHCVLRDKLGQVLSSTENYDVINQLDPHGSDAENRALPGLIAGIQDVRSGEKRHFAIPAEQAFGAYDPSLFIKVHRAEISSKKRIKVGLSIVGRARDGETNRNYRVVGLEGDFVLLDANHPLAGQDLVADVEVKEVRDAEAEDLQPTYEVTPRTLH